MHAAFSSLNLADSCPCIQDGHALSKNLRSVLFLLSHPRVDDGAGVGTSEEPDVTTGVCESQVEELKPITKHNKDRIKQIVTKNLQTTDYN